jgi:hypothetical protein
VATLTVQPRPTPEERRDRLDQLVAAADTAEILVLCLEPNGIAKFATCTANGLDVERDHILTFT